MSEGSEATDGMSKRERREQLAREREERIREKRRKRLEELAEREGTAPMGTAPVQDNQSEPAEGMAMPKGNYGEDASGLFGWVNQNPSSKNAVYMPAFKGGRLLPAYCPRPFPVNVKLTRLALSQTVAILARWSDKSVGGAKQVRAWR